MSTASTITVQRSTPQRATITFTNPPVDLVVAETVVRLHEIVSDLTDDPDIQVVVFKSGLPDFFINHFDLVAATDLPALEVILTSSDYDADTTATTSSCAPPDPPTQQSHVEASRKLWLGVGNSRQ